MIGLLLAGGVSMIVALIGTPVLIRWLQANGIGQPIREDGPQGHFVKAGTPTMGGVMIVVGSVAGYLVGHLRAGVFFTRGGLLVLGAVLIAAIVGFADDWTKVRQERSGGISKTARLVSEIVLGAGFAVLAVEWANVKRNLAFTRFDALDIGVMPVWVYVLFAAFLFAATTNSVNFTDGLDGLAAGSATFSFSAFAIIGFWQFRHFDVYEVPQALDLALVAIALTGGCVGFLWWNAAPARIFMGDTGSLAIGAALAGLTLVMNVHLLFPIIGGLFVLEMVSDLIQIGAFRLFHKRVFRMAPLHHHFELLGWPETTVIIRFWILAGLCTAMSLGVFYADFISLGVLD